MDKSIFPIYLVTPPNMPDSLINLDEDILLKMYEDGYIQQMIDTEHEKSIITTPLAPTGNETVVSDPLMYAIQ